MADKLIICDTNALKYRYGDLKLCCCSKLLRLGYVQLMNQILQAHAFVNKIINVEFALY